MGAWGRVIAALKGTNVGLYPGFKQEKGDAYVKLSSTKSLVPNTP